MADADPTKLVEATTKLFEAVKSGGLPFALLLIALAAIIFVGKNAVSWVIDLMTRGKKRRESLISAYVEIDLHTCFAEKFATEAFLETMTSRIRAHEAVRDVWTGKSSRYKPFLVRATEGDDPKGRIRDGLFWLDPHIIYSVLAWEKTVALEDAMIAALNAEAFVELDTLRKVMFFQSYCAHMREVVRTGRAALHAIETRATYRFVSVLIEASVRARFASAVA